MALSVESSVVYPISSDSIRDSDIIRDYAAMTGAVKRLCSNFGKWITDLFHISSSSQNLASNTVPRSTFYVNLPDKIKALSAVQAISSSWPDLLNNRIGGTVDNKWVETSSLYSSVLNEGPDHERIDHYSGIQTNILEKIDAICFGGNSNVNSTPVAGSEPVYAKAVSKKERLINALEDLNYSLDRLPKNTDTVQHAIKQFIDDVREHGKQAFSGLDVNLLRVHLDKEDLLTEAIAHQLKELKQLTKPPIPPRTTSMIDDKLSKTNSWYVLNNAGERVKETEV